MKPLLKKAFLSETLPGLFRIPQNAHLFSYTTVNWELNWELLQIRACFSGCNKKKECRKTNKHKGRLFDCLFNPTIFHNVRAEVRAKRFTALCSF